MVGSMGYLKSKSSYLKSKSSAGALLGVVALSVLLPACTTSTQTRGYVIDEELMTAISPGVDNRNSVADMLGTPSIVSAFGNETWFYVSRDTVSRGFIEERPLTQTVVEVQFDDGGAVQDVKRYDLADAQEIDPATAITTIRGKTLGFFEQLLRGIGRVGPAGPGGGPGGGRR